MKNFHHITLLVILFSCNANSSSSVSTKDTNAFTKRTDILTDKKNNSLGAEILSDTIAKTKLIVPGVSIGLTHIKQKSEVLVNILGKPDTEDAAMGKSIQSWISKGNIHYETDIYSVTNMGDKNEASRVDQIRVTSPYFMTAEKLGVGSTIENIKKQYPSIIKSGTYTITKTGATNYIYDAIDAGIAFEINAADKCIGVSVHPSKDKAFETYLGFFENYTPLILP